MYTECTGRFSFSFLGGVPLSLSMLLSVFSFFFASSFFASRGKLFPYFGLSSFVSFSDFS